MDKSYGLLSQCEQGSASPQGVPLLAIQMFCSCMTKYNKLKRPFRAGLYTIQRTELSYTILTYQHRHLQNSLVFYVKVFYQCHQEFGILSVFSVLVLHLGMITVVCTWLPRRAWLSACSFLAMTCSVHVI
jgi:hypothetical protein